MSPLAVNEKLATINARAVEIAKTIHVLRQLTWSRDVEQEFLTNVDAGKRPVFAVAYAPPDYSAAVTTLESLRDSFTAEDPLEVFTRDTLQSYIDAAELVMAAGTPRAQELSIHLYGRPGDRMVGSHLTNVAAAQRLVDIAHSFEHPYVKEPEACVTAEAVAEYLRDRIDETFGMDGPEVLLTDRIAAKATAGLERVNLRPGTCFNNYDKDQLLQHEVMTHVLTALNGSKQPTLKLLGASSPRTTRTQEGLATFSEVVTASIDITRLARIALRILAIDKALNGADFWDLYDFFRASGQSERESFWSAARILRGGYPKGGIVFTKDAVYLDGLLKVHTLFRWALSTGRLDITHLLFCGRLSIEDLFMLKDAYADGRIEAPSYLPRWYTNIGGLAGILSFSLVTAVVDEDEILSYFDKGFSAGKLSSPPPRPNATPSPQGR